MYCTSIYNYYFLHSNTSHHLLVYMIMYVLLCTCNIYFTTCMTYTLCNYNVFFIFHMPDFIFLNVTFNSHTCNIIELPYQCYFSFVDPFYLSCASFLTNCSYFFLPLELCNRHAPNIDIFICINVFLCVNTYPCQYIASYKKLHNIFIKRVGLPYYLQEVFCTN